MVAGVAPASSHKRRLAAIRLLPRTSPRCKQLRSAAILRLLPTLMLQTSPSKPVKVILSHRAGLPVFRQIPSVCCIPL